MSEHSKIDSEEVHHIAKLARLNLSPEEAKEIGSNLEDILRYVELLNQLDTSNVTPTSHAIPLPTKYREDSSQPCLESSKTLRGAPERIGDGFGVPKIVE